MHACLFRRSSRCLLGLLIAWLALPCLAAAEHHGSVTFNGLPVPGVTIMLTQGDKTMTTVSDIQGLYSFADVPEGIWRIRLERLCFYSITREVAISSGAPGPEWELKLQPLAEIETETPLPVAAPDLSAVPTTPSTSRSGGNAKGTPVVTAPAGDFRRTDVNASSGTPGRDSVAAPGMAEAGEGGGGASDALLLNGSASTGIGRRVLGNARKGPHSLYHGDLSVMFDNSYLDARQFSLNGQGTPKPVTNNINGGASIGGPLYIPHLLRSNGQFYLQYSLMRNRAGSANTGEMPTPAQRDGDFSQTLSPQGTQVLIYDPSSGQPFPGDVIPHSRLSPQALSLLRFYPLPTFSANAGYNYQVPLVSTQDSDFVQARFNRNLDNKNYVNGDFNYQNRRNSSPTVFSFLDGANSVGMNANAGYRHIFSPRFTMAGGLNFSRFSFAQSPFFANRENVSAEAGIFGNDQEPINWGPPSLTFNGGSAIYPLSDGQASAIHNQTTALSVSGLWLRRAHDIQFGVDLKRQQFNSVSQQNARGGFGFTGAATQALVNGTPVTGTGYDFADFLLGVPDTSQVAFGNADKYFRDSLFDVYLNDDWRVGPGLSINAGLRWDYSSPVIEKFNRLVNLDVGPDFATEAPVEATNAVGSITDVGYPRSLIKPDKRDFQPRVAVAWRPFPASSLQIRASYGIYYDTSVYQRIATNMAQQAPFSKSLSVSSSQSDPLTLANGFNPSPHTTSDGFAVDPNFRPGYAQNWTASAQRELPGSLVMIATYLGIKGTHGQQEFLPNTYPAGALNPCPTCPVGYAYLVSSGNSNRESGQVQLRRRLRNGVTGSLQYQYSKSIDDGSLGGGSTGGSVIAQNWLNLAAERGLSPFDQRHQLQVNLQYTSGMGMRGGSLLSGWRGAVIKGWTFLTVVTAGTGLPETPQCGACLTANTGTAGSVRPDYTGLNVYAAPPGRFLNQAAFVVAPAGQWGNAGRNSITGPAQFLMASSMARSFGNVDIRLDSNNAINHVTFGSWNPNISGAQFGLPASPNGMRTVRLTLRWRF